MQLLLAALVGCEQATAKFVAMKMRVPPIRRIQFLGVDDATWIPVWWPLKRPGLMTNPVMHKFVYINKTTRPTRFELHAERDEWGSLAGPIDQHPLQPSRLQRLRFPKLHEKCCKVTRSTLRVSKPGCGIATSSKKLLGAPGIASSRKKVAPMFLLKSCERRIWGTAHVSSPNL